MSLHINADNFINRDLTPSQMAQSNVNVTSTQTKVVDVANMFVKHRALVPNDFVAWGIKKDTADMLNARVNDMTKNFPKYSANFYTPKEQNSSNYENIHLMCLNPINNLPVEIPIGTPSISGTNFINVFNDMPAYSLKIKGSYAKDTSGTSYIFQVGGRYNYANQGKCGDKCGSGRGRYAPLERLEYGYVYEVVVPDVSIVVWLEEWKKNDMGVVITKQEVPNTRYSRLDKGDTRYMNLLDVGGSKGHPVDPTQWVFSGGSECFRGRAQNCNSFIAKNDPGGWFLENKNWYRVSFNTTTDRVVTKVYEQIVDSTCYSAFDFDLGVGTTISCDSPASKIVFTAVFSTDDYSKPYTEEVSTQTRGTAINNTHVNSYKAFLRAPTSPSMPNFYKTPSPHDRNHKAYDFEADKPTILGW
ncbi:MAG: hypothetical protein ACRCR9_01350 [Chitinophagaceae bacterium]